MFGLGLGDAYCNRRRRERSEPQVPREGAAGGLVPSLVYCQMGPGMARTKGVRLEAVEELPLPAVSLSQHPPLWATPWHNLLLGLPGAS